MIAFNNQLEELNFASGLYFTVRGHIMQESLARDLEKEVQSLEAHAQGMQEQSGKTDTALRVSKDQYLRLTADFENFRKRSVSISPSHMLAVLTIDLGSRLLICMRQLATCKANAMDGGAAPA